VGALFALKTEPEFKRLQIARQIRLDKLYRVRSLQPTRVPSKTRSRTKSSPNCRAVASTPKLTSAMPLAT